MTENRYQNHAVIKISTELCEHRKIPCKMHQKERSSNFLSFKGKHISFGVGKPKLRGFKVGAFLRQNEAVFVQFQPKNFGKSSQPDMHTHMHTYLHTHTHIHAYIHA